MQPSDRADNASEFTYQVGGSLPPNAPTYIERKADQELFQALVRGEFCYVFNARQMGKSSLRVRTMARLHRAGIRSQAIDLSGIGTQQISLEQWYASITGYLAKWFGLEVNVGHWWREQGHLPAVGRLAEFIDQVLLTQIEQPIVVFIDEIDSVLSLKFSVDDFFALIRTCFNRRADNAAYGRLTFALLGVTTPSELITDKTRTPFNVGRAIALQGFQRTEADPLLPGLAEVLPYPEVALDSILQWTGGQPFLTQKLCSKVTLAASPGLIREGEPGDRPSPEPSSPAVTQAWIDHLVQTQILDQWEAQDEPEHLKTIRDRLLLDQQRARQSLGLYQQVLQSQRFPDREPPVMADTAPSSLDLLLSGLVEKQGNHLRVKNPIYQAVFNTQWIQQQFQELRPYAPMLEAWVASAGRDESWLLRGHALQETLDWVQDKRLSDDDYRYLAAGQDLARRDLQRQMEIERLQEIEARLQVERRRSLEQRRNLRRQRILLAGVSVMMVVAIALGSVAFQQYQRTARSEVQAILLSSNALEASNKGLAALLQALKAKQRLRMMQTPDAALKAQTSLTLEQILLNLQERNHLSGHQAAVLTVDYRPDGTEIATAGVDRTIHLWHPDGSLARSLEGHQAIVRTVKYSPKGDRLVSAGDDLAIFLWRRDGTLLRQIASEIAVVWSVAFSPDGSQFAAVGSGGYLERWSREGRLIQRIQTGSIGMRDVVFRPDGRAIATANIDGTITLWNLDGTVQQVLRGHQAPVQALAFSPDGDRLISGSADQTIKIWQADGTLLQTLYRNEGIVWDLAYSPDGTQFASSSFDKTVRVWQRDGTLIHTFYGHDAGVWGVAYSPDGTRLISAGADNQAIVWESRNRFQTPIRGIDSVTGRMTFHPDGSRLALAETTRTIRWLTGTGDFLGTLAAHEGGVSDVAFNADGSQFASSSEDKTVRVWTADGEQLRRLDEHRASVLSVAWNPKNGHLVSSDADGHLYLWDADGRLQQTIKAHGAAVWSVAASADGRWLASAGNDRQVKLWDAQGTLQHTLSGHGAVVWKVAFSPTGDRLASGSGDTTVKLWNLDGTLLKTLTDHTAAVWGIAFSPDGSLLATASVDETVKLWTPEGTLLMTLKGHQAAARSVAFHPTQPLLASIGDDQTLILWNLEEILALDAESFACDWVQDYLRTHPSLDLSDRPLCQTDEHPPTQPLSPV